MKNGTLSTLDHESHIRLGREVVGLLARLGGEHTFHPPPETLAFAMETNHAILANAPEGDLAGFIKMSPWVVNENGLTKMAENSADYETLHAEVWKPVCVEIGSLVVAPVYQGNNLGKTLVREMTDVAEHSYPQLPKIAVVTDDNVPSLHVFGSLGWEIIGRKEAHQLIGIDVLEGWTPPSTIFLFKS